MAKKSRGQKRQVKTKKRQQRRARRSSAPPSRSLRGGMPFGGAPTVPPGFRPIPMTQAMLEFAEPVMAYVENGTLQEPNDALQLAMLVWNSTLPKVPVAAKPPRPEIVDLIQTTLQMDPQEAEAFLDRMIERKEYLFPDEIQPQGSMTMFMRKEVEYLITPFDESQLQLSDEPIPPDGADHTFLEALRQLDARIAAEDDYGDWEDDFFAMQDLCCQQYHHWLRAKGAPEAYADHFPFCVETYLHFIYQYDAGELTEVSFQALEDFFMDYVLRKVMAKPPEYTHWPPALRLFYRFLAEKGYLDDPGPMIERLHAIEPDFIALVKRRS
jgi:hypothetical protein